MKRHKFDTVSFVFGAFFLIVAALAHFSEARLVDVIRTGWPVLLVALGLGILFSARRQRDG